MTKSFALHRCYPMKSISEIIRCCRGGGYRIIRDGIFRGQYGAIGSGDVYLSKGHSDKRRPENDLIKLLSSVLVLSVL